MTNLFIMRVGNMPGNFSRSVLDRLEDGKPIWGYNSNRCCGFRSVSNSTHDEILSAIRTYGHALVLFKPSKNGSLVGLAMISNVYQRITGAGENDANGWTDTTPSGSSDWNIQMDIDRYWDLTLVANDAFHHETITQMMRITQSSIHPIREGHGLYNHLMHHIENVQSYFHSVHG